MLFRLQHRSRQDVYTHAGVLEFTAEEGRCYVPSWVCVATVTIHKHVNRLCSDFI